MTHDLPNLQDLAHEGRTSSESRLRPVLGQGGVEHDAGAFVRSAQGGTGGDCGGSSEVVRQAGCDLYLHANIWHARRVLANGKVVCGLGYTKQEATDDLEANWGEKE